MDDSRKVEWRQASRCESGTCIQVAKIDGRYAIRNSTDPDGPTLTFSADEWRAFEAAVRDGEFTF